MVWFDGRDFRFIGYYVGHGSGNTNKILGGSVIICFVVPIVRGGPESPAGGGLYVFEKLS
jgi:hypothetical protein